MKIGKAISIPNFALIMGTLHYTGGKHAIYIPLPNIEKAFHLSFIGNLLWLWTLTWVKISIALMLLRIKKSKPWKWGIGALIAILCLAGITATTAELIQCAPIEANWSILLHQSSCWPNETVESATYALSCKYTHRRKMYSSTNISSCFRCY